MGRGAESEVGIVKMGHSRGPCEYWTVACGSGLTCDKTV